MNTAEGHEKGVETMRKRYGDDIYAKIGAKGGKNSTNRPMRDPAYASRAAKIRWLRYKYDKGQVSDREYSEKMQELVNVRTTAV